MLINPKRAEEKLHSDLAKIRIAVRMRFGIVAGVVIVGLLQTNFNVPPGLGFADLAAAYIRIGGPVLGLAVVGVLIVLALARRDINAAQARFESQTFRVPKRKTKT
jgi:hypothetical protein